MIEFVSADIGSTATDKYPLESALERARRAVEEYTQKLASAQDNLKYAEAQLEKWKTQNRRMPQVGEFWRYIKGDTNTRAKIIRTPKGKYGVYYSIEYRPNDSYKVLTDVEAENLTEFVAPAREDGEFKKGDEVEFWGVRCGVVAPHVSSIHEGLPTYDYPNGKMVLINLMDERTKQAITLPSSLKLITPVEMRNNGQY